MDVSILSSIIISASAIFVTLYFSWHSKKLAHEQLLKQLFKDFNERYDKLNHTLMYIEKYCPTYDEFKESKLNSDLREKIIDYFNLCAEEYFWYRHKKRIDEVIWKSWNAGMNYWYKLDTIKKLWQEEIKNDGRILYYLKDKKGFFDE